MIMSDKANQEQIQAQLAMSAARIEQQDRQLDASIRAGDLDRELASQRLEMEKVLKDRQFTLDQKELTLKTRRVALDEQLGKSSIQNDTIQRQKIQKEIDRIDQNIEAINRVRAVGFENADPIDIVLLGGPVESTARTENIRAQTRAVAAGISQADLRIKIEQDRVGLEERITTLRERQTSSDITRNETQNQLVQTQIDAAEQRLAAIKEIQEKGLENVDEATRFIAGYESQSITNLREAQAGAAQAVARLNTIQGEYLPKKHALEEFVQKGQLSLSLMNAAYNQDRVALEEKRVEMMRQENALKSMESLRRIKEIDFRIAELKEVEATFEKHKGQKDLLAIPPADAARMGLAGVQGQLLVQQAQKEIAADKAAKEQARYEQEWQHKTNKDLRSYVLKVNGFNEFAKITDPVLSRKVLLQAIRANEYYNSDKGYTPEMAANQAHTEVLYEFKMAEVTDDTPRQDIVSIIAEGFGHGYPDSFFDSILRSKGWWNDSWIERAVREGRELSYKREKALGGGS
jgi:hypothetical protein